MDTDMPESQWKQVSSQAKIFWIKLDDEDLEHIAGKTDRLAGLLQGKYGYTRQNADKQSARWMRKHSDEPGDLA
jgi:uncharacterized protein YjbJ (UPF0337 family)